MGGGSSPSPWGRGARQASHDPAEGRLTSVQRGHAHSSSSLVATSSLAPSLVTQPIRLFLTGSLLEDRKRDHNHDSSQHTDQYYRPVQISTIDQYRPVLLTSTDQYYRPVQASTTDQYRPVYNYIDQYMYYRPVL